MKQIAMWQADDGSRWDTMAGALRRDELVIKVEGALKPLGECVDGDGYYQHSPETVQAVKAALLELTRPFLAEWMDTQEKTHGVDLTKIDVGYFCRLLDGRDSEAVSRAWGRMLCIDEQCREWEQPYYAAHPEEATQVCLNEGWVNMTATLPPRIPEVGEMAT